MVTLEPETVRVDAGQAAKASIAIRNDSGVVELFRIEVEGLEPTWYRLSDDSVSLFPDGQATSTLTISPPMESVSGRHPFAIKVTPHTNPAQVAAIRGYLEINPHASFGLDLRPTRSTASAGYHSLFISNTGNVELTAEIEGRDPEELCRFFFSSSHPRVPPGSELTVDVEVHPMARPWLGRPRHYDFVITVAPRQTPAEAKSVTGALEATPLIPWWSVAAGLAGLMAFLLITALNPVAGPALFAVGFVLVYTAIERRRTAAERRRFGWRVDELRGELAREGEPSDESSSRGQDAAPVERGVAAGREEGEVERELAVVRSQLDLPLVDWSRVAIASAGLIVLTTGSCLTGLSQASGGSASAVVIALLVWIGLWVFGVPLMGYWLGRTSRSTGFLGSAIMGALVGAAQIVAIAASQRSELGRDLLTAIAVFSGTGVVLASIGGFFGHLRKTRARRVTAAAGVVTRTQ